MRKSKLAAGGVLAAALVLLALAAPATEPARSSEAQATLPSVHVYKTPTCGCCGKWVDHLRAHGFEVRTTDLPRLDTVKRMNGVPRQLESCHTAIVGSYVVEGHVPAGDVLRLLAEKPAISGLAVPGMPAGSPGMEGPNPERYRTFAFDGDANVSTFAVHGP
jgi:hypothetical protein